MARRSGSVTAVTVFFDDWRFDFFRRGFFETGICLALLCYAALPIIAVALHTSTAERAYSPFAS
jgi:hypothetical protein